MRYNRVNGNPTERLLSIGDLSNVEFVVYNVSEGHLECAGDDAPPQEVERKFHLAQSLIEEIYDDSEGKHAVLAYDFANDTVTLVDSSDDFNVMPSIAFYILNVARNGAVSRPQVASRPNRVKNVDYNEFDTTNNPWTFGGGEDPLSGLIDIW